MLRIKRLYIYILQTFVPIFFMTFVICLFLILMQFLWKYVEDLVGKGLETHVLTELFFYAALTLVPMALPLAILLASLMSFGNLGEKYELLAIKAAGISLLRTMRPLIVLVILISIGAFVFQNDIIPRVQVKLRVLMLSVKQKSPELAIPENTFYSDISNYNLFVKTKNKKTGMLYDVMIYDTSNGFDNMAVIVCDSAKMGMSSDKDYLLLNMYNGQQFKNFQQSINEQRRVDPANQFIPYSRENFKEKKVVIPFDANFNRIDESAMDNSQISKNVFQLNRAIDSLKNTIDSMNIIDRKFMLNYTYNIYRSENNLIADDTTTTEKSEKPELSKTYSLDSILQNLTLEDKVSVYRDAMVHAENNKNDFMFRSISKLDTQRNLRRHGVELQRKFVLSFACVIFFFIGAPLGAIIRKGGLGMPVVISVILFIIYYIIDNVGYKMARDGIWEVWQGVWLSSFILFPLGVFITYKAINDSDLFNPEAYGKYLRKILFIEQPLKISNERGEAINQKIPRVSDLNITHDVLAGLNAMESDDLRNILDNSKQYASDKKMQIAALSILRERGADINNVIAQQDPEYATRNITLYTQSSYWAIGAYFLALILFILNLKTLSIIGEIIYLVLYLRSQIYYFRFYGKVDKKMQYSHIITSILQAIFYPITFFIVKKQMKNYLKKIQIISN